MDYKQIVKQRIRRAETISRLGDIDKAIASGALDKYVDVTLSEIVVLGLLRQGVKKYVGIFGHGSTELGEVLRVYEKAGLIKTYNVRNEVGAAHAAMALRWVTGEKAATFTSIGPGALQAMAGSLAAASDGIGVWHIYGDETTEDEGPNMQQISGNQQGLFLRLCQDMGNAYNLHTPGAIGTALRRGLNSVDHPYKAGPFYLLLPMNIQSTLIKDFNLDELPVGAPPKLSSANGDYTEAAKAILEAERVVVKIGGGARDAGDELTELLELADGVAVTSPLVSGVIPYMNPRNMTVGGSKGSLSGNYAMDEADLLIAIGTRFVCQSDSSRTGYPKAKQVININADIEDATHYNKSIALVGGIKETLTKLNAELKVKESKASSQWFADCTNRKAHWEAFKKERYDNPTLFDEIWKKEVLTQPAAIKTVVDWAKAKDAVTFFDSGDVQANGFQIVEDDKPGRTFNETGASYMGFAASALMATAMTDHSFYGIAMAGDGSFMMNPQILIDGVEHGAKGCIMLFDNRRMAAISSLQNDQFGVDYATNDTVEVDYIAMARSVKGVAAFDGGCSTQELLETLEKAKAHDGLSLICVPVYAGGHELGGMGVYGRWNVGNWCQDVQALRHKIGL
ncbi:MAG: thiamine pyrophosphate-binding protein [Bacteroidota bacterium]|nr:thiamine pyrophosphate-binding protein [Bacteroidota bacterium]